MGVLPGGAMTLPFVKNYGPGSLLLHGGYFQRPPGVSGMEAGG